jgi:hypothetical protein
MIGSRQFEKTFSRHFRASFILKRKPQTSHINYEYFVCVPVLCTINYFVFIQNLCFCFSWRGSEYSRGGLHTIFLGWPRMSLGLHWILNIGIFTSISPGRWRDISRLLLFVFHRIFHNHITITRYSLLVYSTV